MAKRGNIFKNVLSANPTSNVFDLSHDVKLSLNMGDLVPVSLMECVPGDKFNITTEQMLRLAPMVAPVMHQVNVTVHFFFVPNRILWPNWEQFITGGDMGSITPALPILNESVAPNSLHDYLGLPLGANNGVSAFPAAAYQCIYNEFYRDQNLIPEIDYKLNNGQNSLRVDLTTLRRRAWEHDYFTSALPFAQKGDPVTIPINGTTAPIFRNSANQQDVILQSDNGEGDAIMSSYPDPTGTPPNDRMYADLQLNDAQATINDLRKAFKLQEWLEKNARGGSRYIEQLLVHFGVKSSDARLQRPEYLGGNKNPIVISEVLQTAGSDDTTPQGNMAGHGIGIGQSKAISYRCEEHGYIMGIMSVLPKTAYQQGVPRHFSRMQREDYYWPSFAHLGEQEIKNKEIYNDAADPTNDDTFGYTPRYSEYKYVPSRVAGDFRNSLAFWHMGRIFSERPHLNGNFVTSDPTHRIFAVEDPTSQKIYAHVFNRVSAVRKMPLFGTPSF